jgi:hypothetical protein
MKKSLIYLFVLGVLLILSCSPKIQVTIIQNNNTKITGLARQLPDSATIVSKLVYWDNNNIKHKLKPFEIKSFTLQGLDYESVNLKRRPNITMGKQIFLRRLVDGPMILYRFDDLTVTINLFTLLTGNLCTKCVNYTYVRKETDSVAHRILKQKCKSDIWPTIIIQPSNFNEFSEYFSDVPPIQKKILEGTYKRDDIFDIVNEYNKLKNK